MRSQSISEDSRKELELKKNHILIGANILWCNQRNTSSYSNWGQCWNFMFRSWTKYALTKNIYKDLINVAYKYVPQLICGSTTDYRQTTHLMNQMLQKENTNHTLFSICKTKNLNVLYFQFSFNTKYIIVIHGMYIYYFF